MAVARLADRLQVPVRRNDHPVRTGDRLENHGGDRLRPLVHEDLLEVRPARADGARLRMAGRAAIRVGVEHPHDAGEARLGGPAARIAGQRDRPGGCPVVGPVARDDLVAAGVPARELDRVLVRLGATVREERHRSSDANGRSRRSRAVRRSRGTGYRRSRRNTGLRPARPQSG